MYRGWVADRSQLFARKIWNFPFPCEVVQYLGAGFGAAVCLRARVLGLCEVVDVRRDLGTAPPGASFTRAAALLGSDEKRPLSSMSIGSVGTVAYIHATWPCHRVVIVQGTWC